MVRREILAVLRASDKGPKSPKPEKPRPAKFGFHAFHIDLYLHEFFELILFFDPMDYSSWSEGKFWLF